MAQGDYREKDGRRDMSPLRYSVVIPAFNAAQTVGAAIASALAQSAGALEVVVVDDGSTDATAAAVSAIGNERVRLVSQRNRGLPAARNAGAAAARGELLAFLDSDDLLLGDYLELAGQALADDPGAGFAYTDAYVLDEASGRVRQRSAMAREQPPLQAPASSEALLEELLRRNFVYVAAVVRSEVFAAVGGFDERLRSSEDYDLWLRIASAGWRAARVPGRHAVYRKHGGQMSRRLVTMSESLAEVYERLSDEQLPSERHRELLADRRRAAARELRLMRRVGRFVPVSAISALKRAGVGERWYAAPPPEVAGALAQAGRLPASSSR